MLSSNGQAASRLCRLAPGNGFSYGFLAPTRPAATCVQCRARHGQVNGSMECTGR